MSGQLRAAKASSCDCNRARTDCFAARDVVWRVADDIDLRGREIDRVLIPRPLARELSQLVAIVVIVGKGAELEKIPEPVMRELQFRSALQVASEEAENVL